MILKEIKYVLAIYENGTLARAAEKLYISQPALSKYIHNLENSLNIKLFERVGNRLRPTYYGESYLQAAKHIDEIYQQLEQEVYASDQMIRGRFRIGTTRRGAYIIPNVLPSLMTTFPMVDITLHEKTAAELEKALSEGEMDAIIIKQPDIFQKHTAYVPLYAEELVLTTAAGHPHASLARRREDLEYPWIDLSLFQGEFFILYKPNNPNRVFTEKILGRYQIAPRKTLETNNIEMALRLCASGMCVCFTPALYARECMLGRELRFFSFGEPVMRYSYYLAYRKDAYLTRYAKEFIRLLLEYYGDERSFPGPQPAVPFL